MRFQGSVERLLFQAGQALPVSRGASAASRHSAKQVPADLFH